MAFINNPLSFILKILCMNFSFSKCNGGRALLTYYLLHQGFQKRNYNENEESAILEKCDALVLYQFFL